MNNYSIYKRIYELAQKKGLSLQKLAEKAGVSTNLIYSWKNKKHPSKTSLKKVADVLNTTPEFLEGIKPVSSEKGLTWQDFGMAYGGRIPNDLKDMYKALAEQYVKNHPEALKQSEEDEDDELW